MARPLDEVADIDSIRYDDLSYDGEHGRVGVTLFMPSARQLGLRGDPDLVVPYSAGWSEGRGAAVAACEALTQVANVMSVAVTYPKKSLAVGEILPFRAAVFQEVLTYLKEETHYDSYDIVVCGYSRGTAAARLASVALAAQVRGICLVAPTWYEADVKPLQLAQKGLVESAKGARHGSWMDKLGLVGKTAKLAQELVTHPLELRKDVAAVAADGTADLHSLVDAGLRVGVVAGTEDDVCSLPAIRDAIAELHDPDHVDFREVDCDHYSYFLAPGPLAEIAAQIVSLGE